MIVKNIHVRMLLCGLLFFSQSFFVKAQDVKCANGEATGFTYPITDWQASCGYGVRCADDNHMGTDGVPASGNTVGSAVVAPCSGVVKESQSHGGYGGMVILECWTGSECVTAFVGHMYSSTLAVTPNQSTVAGETVIGYLADSANNGGWEPHAHFGVRKGGYASTVYSGCSANQVWSYAGYPYGCAEEMANDMYNPDEFVASHALPDSQVKASVDNANIALQASPQDFSDVSWLSHALEVRAQMLQSEIIQNSDDTSLLPSPENTDVSEGPSRWGIILDFIEKADSILHDSPLDNLYDLTAANYLGLTNEQYQDLLYNPQGLDMDDVRISSHGYVAILSVSAAKHFAKGGAIEFARGIAILKTIHWVINNKPDYFVLSIKHRNPQPTIGDKNLLDKIKDAAWQMLTSFQTMTPLGQIFHQLNGIKNLIDQNIAERLGKVLKSPAETPQVETTPQFLENAQEYINDQTNCDDPYSCTNHKYNDPKVKALLDVIAYAEGTADDADGGYGRVVFGQVVEAPYNPELVGQYNVTISDFSKHPNILVALSPTFYSTAAGRYQFLYKTWEGLGLSDFSPQSQDIGAAMLLENRGALDLILQGDFEAAILASNKEWASLPGSPYGQPTHDMSELVTVYQQALQH